MPPFNRPPRRIRPLLSKTPAEMRAVLSSGRPAEHAATLAYCSVPVQSPFQVSGERGPAFRASAHVRASSSRRRRTWSRPRRALACGDVGVVAAIAAASAGAPKRRRRPPKAIAEPTTSPGRSWVRCARSRPRPSAACCSRQLWTAPIRPA